MRIFLHTLFHNLDERIFNAPLKLSNIVPPQLITMTTKDGNINPLSIGYANRPHLRTA